MLRSFSIFKRIGAQFIEKMTFEKNKDLRFECFENFAINGKYSQKNYNNPNYYPSL
jgi:hypothetical protein